MLYLSIKSWFPLRKINFSNILSDRLVLLGECTKLANENKSSTGADEHRLVLYFINSYVNNLMICYYLNR